MNVRKRFSLPYIVLVVVIVMALSIPKKNIQSSRGAIAAVMIPVWQTAKIAGNAFVKPFASLSFSAKGRIEALEQENARLSLENMQLNGSIADMAAMITDEQYITYQIDTLRNLSKMSLLSENVIRRHYKELGESLRSTFQSVSAHVIFRDVSSWSSSLWINVGDDDNKGRARTVIAKNSPVVVGAALVGVVDYVGKKQSRVRLITDSGLNPSVRTSRGSQQAMVMSEHIAALVRFLTDAPDDLLPDKDEKELIQKYLESWSLLLSGYCNTWHLAKGILEGSSMPLWKSGGSILRGVGFNYDYADDEGAARDLRTGKHVGEREGKEIALVRKGDVLITTGMDGVFPKGLHVATVTEVFPLKEGGYGYDFEAVPVAHNIEEIDIVSILPPVGYDSDDLPSDIMMRSF